MPKCPYCNEEKDLKIYPEDSECDWNIQEVWESYNCRKCNKQFFIVGRMYDIWYEDSNGWKLNQKKETRKDTDV